MVAQSNLLPYDGIVTYYGTVFSEAQARTLNNSMLSSIKWQQDELIIFGKKIITKRKVAWYGERPFAYSYSNTSKLALPWTEELIAVKALVEAKTKRIYNSCLLKATHAP